VLRPPEDEERFGGGAVACATCLVENRVGAMFCSACEHLLPKTFAGTLFPDPVNAFATHCYNRAQHLLAQGELSEAANLLRTALQHRDHQDYRFFLGVCQCGLGDPEGAIEAFDRTGADQWSGELPVWYPPLSPSELTERRRELRERVDSALVFEQLVTRISQNIAAQRELS
jgi:tetratricopeptide (TPR) repeat protein